MRRNLGNRDKNHSAFVGALRAAGWFVAETHALDGFVDVIAIKGGRVVFLEFKAGRVPSERIPKPHQVALHRELRSFGAEVAVVTNESELFALCGIQVVET